MAEAQASLSAQKERLKACNKDIEERTAAVKKLQKEHHAAELQVQELDHCATKTKENSKSASKTVRQSSIAHSMPDVRCDEVLQPPYPYACSFWC